MRRRSLLWMAWAILLATAAAGEGGESTLPPTPWNPVTSPNVLLDGGPVPRIDGTLVHAPRPPTKQRTGTPRRQAPHGTSQRYAEGSEVTRTGPSGSPLEGLAAAPEMILGGLCTVLRQAAMVPIRSSRDQFPKDLPIRLRIKAIVADSPIAGTASGCPARVEVLASESGWAGSPEMKIQGDTREFWWNTTGLGPEIDYKANAWIRFLTKGPIVLGGQCNTTTVSAQAVISIAGRHGRSSTRIPLTPLELSGPAAAPGEIIAPASIIEWEVSNPSVLEHVKHTGPVMSAAGPNLKSTALFRAVGPGTAYVVAKVQRVDPSVLDGLTDDPVRRAELARELKLASTATLRVNVGGDREPLHVEATTTSGAPTPIRVFGLEPGTCIQRELSDAPGLVLTLLDGEGEIANGVYSPPPLSPDALWIHTPDNPVAFCESVNLEAGVDFGHGIGDVHVKAELPDGRVGVGAIGRWAPDVSNEIEWLEPTTAVLSSPNSRELLLAIIDPLELDDLPLHVSYTHEGTTLEAEALLRILPVQRRMLLSPHPSVRATHRPSFQVGPGAWVDPSAWLEVEGEPGRCDPPPIRDLTQKIKWTLRPPGEAPHPLDPPEQLQVAGEYRLLARYPMSSGGDFVSWTDIEVLPSRATVRVGPVQPGLPRTGADPRR